jgi:hypothetical protein
MRRQTQILIAALNLVAGFSIRADAATSAVNASTVSPTLQISVTVQKAIALTLSQGAGAGACNITTASDYSISFGNVDALGINTPTCGAKFDPTTPGVSASAYYTDYKLTPMFTNQSATSATVTAYVSTNFATLSSILRSCRRVPRQATSVRCRPCHEFRIADLGWQQSGQRHGRDQVHRRDRSADEQRQFDGLRIGYGDDHVHDDGAVGVGCSCAGWPCVERSLVCSSRARPRLLKTLR